MDKDAVRSLYKELGMEDWNRPSYTCLATRIPYGMEITKDALSAVEQAEVLLENMGATQIRVRLLDRKNARIETSPSSFEMILSQRDAIIQEFGKLGFITASLDLAGYRQGSMNEIL